MEIDPLIPIGTKIKVDKAKIEELRLNKILDDMPELITGEVIDYKMTDGMGIGYVLITENHLKIWIFQSEINEQTIRDYKIGETNKDTNIMNKNIIFAIDEVNYDINGNKAIKTIINPINLFSWFIYTIKDIL